MILNEDSKVIDNSHPDNGMAVAVMPFDAIIPVKEKSKEL